ncbi:MAG: hypothetical protein Q8R91_02285 [Candidatus Omnitrophota bacterium]|nr:hypothetical protein [Candidatus Omnitrophota bacterium]
MTVTRIVPWYLPAWLVVHAQIVPMALAASLTLSVSSLRGGSTIDLGRLGAHQRTTHEEVTIELAGAAGTSYRLLQSLSSPLRNEAGTVLEPSRVMLELAGGDSGTVRFRAPAPLSEGTTELFTSSSTGQSERLTAIYSVSVDDLPEGGAYAGTLTYTMQEVEGSSVETVTVPIRLLVQPVVSLAVSEGSPARVAFGSLDPGSAATARALSLTLVNNTAAPMQLTQDVEASVVNEQGEPLPLAAVRMRLASATTATEEQALEPRMRLLASERPRGPSERVELSYHVTVPDDQPAGQYRGILRFTLVAPGGVMGGEPVSLQVPMELEIRERLSLSVQAAEGGPPELVFTRLTPGTTSSPKTLLVTVQTNTGRAYELAQVLSHRLVNDEGRQLPEDALSWTAHPVERGRVVVGQRAPVPVGRGLIYQSDEHGASVEFPISYQVDIPEDASAGVYHSSLVYTVTSF